MIINEKIELDRGALFQGDRLIGVVEGGTFEEEYFIPDRFVYKTVSKSEDVEDDNTCIK
jgi:hypothetical protein